MTDDYFAHPRPEVQGLIPTSARFIIDVGCGAGQLGASLKQERPGVEVRGIEIDPEAAARAARVLDDVATATAEDDPPGSWPAADCVVFADVLEHTLDPWTVLHRWRSRLREGACIVVSLPNVAHLSVVDDLRRGRWTYGTEGILDRTHVRFFTRETACEMVQQAGFRVDVVRRALARPADFVRGQLLWTVVRVGVRLEGTSLGPPPWMVRAMDACSRQFQLRAFAIGTAATSSPGDRT